MKNNVVLIGMPGVGKSTLGVVLAKELGYEFVDADLLIQKREKRLLKEIIAAEGVDGFLKIENDVNAGIQAENTVCALVRIALQKGTADGLKQKTAQRFRFSALSLLLPDESINLLEKAFCCPETYR